MNPFSSRFLALFFALLYLVGASRLALSHAILLEAVPAVDSTIAGQEVSVKLRFNVRIDRSRSRLSLLFPDGKSISLKIGDDQNADSLTAQATGLVPGAYRLRWQVLAGDGHITRGEVPFRVSGP